MTRDPFTSLPEPSAISGGLEPSPGQQALPLHAAGYRPPPALSPSYPYLPVEAPE